MTHLKYITDHLFPSWVQSWTYNFKIWADLMTNNYEAYDNPWCESPERECYEWFWASINMVDDINSGKVKKIPFRIDLDNNL